MLKVTKSADGEHRYVGIQGFKDEEEQRIVFEKVQLLIKEWQSKRKVFG